MAKSERVTISFTTSSIMADNLDLIVREFNKDATAVKMTRSDLINYALLMLIKSYTHSEENNKKEEE